MSFSILPHRTFVSFPALVAVALTAPHVAHAQHGDITFYDDNGALAVGLIEESTSTITPGARVFEAVLVPETLPFSPFQYSRNEPGFDVLDGELPANQAIDLPVVSISKWDGVAFVPAFGVLFGFQPASLMTDADGGRHDHPLLGLTDLTLDPAPLEDGAYLGLFRAQTAGLAPSPTIALVMLKDELLVDEEAAEELEDLLEAYAAGGPEPVFGGKNFAFFGEAVEAASAIVPEPSTAMLAVVATVATAARRRR